MLPDGVHDFPRPPVFGKRRTRVALLYNFFFCSIESAVNKATEAALKGYEINMVTRYKEELMLALKRYDAVEI